VHEQCPKTYVAHGKIGVQTDTADEQGQVLNQSDPSLVCAVTMEQLKTLEHFFKGEYWQSPPAFSALKHQGKPLYEYARQGQMIEKPRVLRTIERLKILSLEGDIVSFEVTVSSGTYVRTLFEDMMGQLGLLGHLIDLTRTRIGALSIESSLRSDHWPRRDGDDAQNYIEKVGISVQTLLPWPVIELDEHNERMFRQGVSQRTEQIEAKAQDDGPHWFYGTKLLGAAQVKDDLWRQLFQF
jgi:tRNA pseudouridine55 synthase